MCVPDVLLRAMSHDSCQNITEKMSGHTKASFAEDRNLDKRLLFFVTRSVGIPVPTVSVANTKII